MIFLNDYVFEIWNNNGVRANDEKLSGAFPRSNVGERKLLHFNKKKSTNRLSPLVLCVHFSPVWWCFYCAAGKGFTGLGLGDRGRLSKLKGEKMLNKSRNVEY